MATYSKADFKKWGRQGGRKRARAIPRSRRSAIASQAARSRWASPAKASESMSSIRLSHPDWEDPVYLEEILAEGGLPEWKELYRRIREHPFSPTAEALAQTLSFASIYGAVPLWKGLLKNVRGT